MRDRFCNVVVVVTATLAFSGAAFSQASAPPDAKARNQAIYSGTHHEGAVPHHDLSGVWMISEDFRFSPTHEPPSSFLQPWALARLNAEPIQLRQDLPQSHAGSTTGLGRDEDITCSSPRLTFEILNQKPIEIVHTPQRTFMFFEYGHTYREIWMDGRALPSDPDPSYLGTSIGRWDGDTLVVETVGFNEETLIDGMPHSDAAHLVERYTRPDLDTLEVTFKADDPKAYTKPWTSGPMKLAWHPDWRLEEAFCIQDDNSAFKKAIIDPSWSKGDALNDGKGKKSDPK